MLTLEIRYQNREPVCAYITELHGLAVTLDLRETIAMLQEIELGEPQGVGGFNGIVHNFKHEFIRGSGTSQVWHLAGVNEAIARRIIGAKPALIVTE